ncbi:hypothetical protein, partial [Bacillus cereus]|uniref:hypothetical protein n=1 Tax=Bacillus cereus TaxID=1396 RepID=UPI001A8D0E05
QNRYLRKRGMNMEKKIKVLVELEVFEDIDDVNITDRVTEGVCDQMQDVFFDLLSVEIVD